MVSENIWHQWFLVGIVESETMLSRSALAHIFDNVKAKASPSIGSAKRGLLIVHRRNHFKVRYCIISCDLILFLSAAARQPPRLEADESIINRPRKSLLAAFNGTAGRAHRGPARLDH